MDLFHLWQKNVLSTGMDIFMLWYIYLTETDLFWKHQSRDYTDMVKPVK